MSNNTGHENVSNGARHDYSQRGSNVPPQPTIPKMPAPATKPNTTKK